MPKPPPRGRKPSVDFREILNAIRYMARSAGGWRMLPHEFGPWQTVYWWFRRFVRRLLFRTIHDVALMLDRDQAGREASPSGGVLDSQTVKAPFAEARGYDGGKKTVGRKRHVAVDTDGRLLMVNLTTADVSDSAGAQLILEGIRKRWPWLKQPVRRRQPTIGPGCWTRRRSLTSSSRSLRRSDPQSGLRRDPRDAGSSNARSAG